jgi:hypothetical protein
LPQQKQFDERVDIMNTTKRQRLVSTLSDESTRALGVVLKCGICLALLTLLVVIGVSEEKVGVPADALDSVSHAASAAKLSGAAAHRKEVFDERRARFAGSASEHLVAKTAPAADDQAYVP